MSDKVIEYLRKIKVMKEVQKSLPNPSTLSGQSGQSDKSDQSDQSDKYKSLRYRPLPFTVENPLGLKTDN